MEEYNKFIKFIIFGLCLIMAGKLSEFFKEFELVSLTIDAFKEKEYKVIILLIPIVAAIGIGIYTIIIAWNKYNLTSLF